MAVHELRTPITAMRGYIEVFEDEVTPSLNSEQKQFMKALSAQAQQLGSFINNVQNFAKIEENSMSLNLKSEDWGAIVAKAVQDMQLRAQVRKKNVLATMAQSAAATKGVWGTVSLFGLAVLLLTILGALALAGCTGPTAAPVAPAGGGDQPSGAATPKVNRLVMAVETPLIESNENRHLSPPYSWVLRPMYEHLIGIDPTNGRMAPQLATEWSVEPNGTSYRFKLRRGVQWHGNRGEYAKDRRHYQNFTDGEASIVAKSQTSLGKTLGHWVMPRLPRILGRKETENRSH